MKLLTTTLILFISFFSYANVEMTLEERIFKIESSENVKHLFKIDHEQESALKHLSPDFIDFEDIQTDEENIENIGYLNTTDDIRIRLPGYLQESPIQALATVQIGFDNQEYIQPHSFALAQIHKELDTNEEYSVLRYDRKVQYKNSGRLLHYYLYLGDVKTVYLENKAHMVLETPSTTFMKTGDILVPKLEATRTLGSKNAIVRTYEGKAKILDLKYHNATFFSQGDIIYLNKGSEEGLLNNQILDIYSDSNIFPTENTFPLPIGTLQIIETQKHSSSAIILSSHREIYAEDFAQKRN